MSTSTASRLELSLGHTQEDPVSLDLAASPHTLVIGGTSTGRCAALRHLAAQGLDRGFELVIIDPIRRGFGFEAVSDSATVAHTFGEAIDELEVVAAELARRIDLLLASGASTVRDLPASEGMRPILVVIEEYAVVTREHRLPRELDEQDAMYKDARKFNAQAELIRRLTARILRGGRYAGIHLVIGTQRAELTDHSAVLRENIGNVIMTVRPGQSLSTYTAAIVFSHVAGGEAAVRAAYDEATAAKDPGHAVLGVASGATAFRFPHPAEA
ncbi:FtsK/SpoIIIE domain-containing protein [Arthrobacter sp. 162MFSha1.1]|uniref:FtsK/SpoIIIE domain-containing protein n=1 Tax=Arthrobacter sp. 162MFSha1.1 TaxID=1151119 RepID=UPI000373966C|nr:FtsK/SpoIIIE domain-containing protein [Arthrobacter sp. 162MFSha1.1]